MFTRLIESLAATEALSQVFSDGAVLQAMLDFEAALARAEARVGVIPEDAAAAITDAAVAESFDIAKLVRQSLRAGTPAIPLVRMLTERVRARDQGGSGFCALGGNQSGRHRYRFGVVAAAMPASAGSRSSPRVARVSKDLE